MIFSQKDPLWSSMKMGSSPYTIGSFGCLTTAQAQAMQLAGYLINPEDLAIHPELYTDEHYKAGPGLWLWNKMGDFYPQYHFLLSAEGMYKFVQVIATYPSGRYEHWVLQVNETYYDPLDGTSGGLKANYRPTGIVRSANIDPAPPPAEPDIPENIPVKILFKYNRTVKITASPYLNCRTEPTSQGGDANIFKKLPLNHLYYVKGYVRKEDVEGNDIWYITANDHYFAAFYTDQPNPSN